MGGLFMKVCFSFGDGPGMRGHIVCFFLIKVLLISLKPADVIGRGIMNSFLSTHN